MAFCKITVDLSVIIGYLLVIGNGKVEIMFNEKLEIIRKAEANWKKASARGHAEAMTEYNKIITEATNELIDAGYTMAEIWAAV